MQRKSLMKCVRRTGFHGIPLLGFYSLNMIGFIRRHINFFKEMSVISGFKPDLVSSLSILPVCADTDDRTAR